MKEICEFWIFWKYGRFCPQFRIYFPKKLNIQKSVSQNFWILYIEVPLVQFSAFFEEKIRSDVILKKSHFCKKIANFHLISSKFLKFLYSYQQNHLISLKLIGLHHSNKFFSIYGQNTEKYGPKRANFDQISSIYFCREVVRWLTFKVQ